MAKKKQKKKAQVEKLFKQFVPYLYLVNHPSQWGQEFTDKKEFLKFKSSPSVNALQIGLLCKIYFLLDVFRPLLEGMLDELKREKTIK